MNLDDTQRSEVCPFCEIIAGRAPATIVREWDDALAIVPLGPVVEGHLLVIPKLHVEDFTAAPAVAGMVMAHASELAAPPCNIITSAFICTSFLGRTMTGSRCRGTRARGTGPHDQGPPGRVPNRRPAYRARVAKTPRLLIQAEPVGEVTAAATPIPVEATLRYRMEPGVDVIHGQPGKAIAWTAGQVLVRMDINGFEWWLPAADVARV